MTAGQRPKAPAGLGTAGRSLWRRLTAAYEFEQHELPTLELAARQCDDIAVLEELLRTQGGTVPGSTGRPRLNPIFGELRQGRIALSRLLGALALPDEDDRPMSATSRAAQHAARSRWTRTRHQQARIRGAAS